MKDQLSPENPHNVSGCIHVVGHDLNKKGKVTKLAPLYCGKATLKDAPNGFLCGEHNLTVFVPEMAAKIAEAKAAQ